MSINVCWQCHQVLNRELTPKCPICGWNICPDDGACTDPSKPEYGKCVCSYAAEKEERSYLRICYTKGERTREEFFDVAQEYLDVYRENKAREAREKAIAIRREKEELVRKERERAEALRNTIIRDRILQRYIEDEYVGDVEFVTFYKDARYEYITVKLLYKAGVTTSFWYPQCFEKGYLCLISNSKH